MKNNEKKAVELARKTPEINPFSMMRRFTEDMERMFDNSELYRFPTIFEQEFSPFRTEFANVEWMPEVELLQNNGELMVKTDLPGLTKDDVKVELTDKVLTISGERKDEKEEKREGFYRTERNYGRFFRQIPLPEGVQADKASATFRNGVLEVTMPAPKIESRARKLEIKEEPEKQMKAAA